MVFGTDPNNKQWVQWYRCAPGAKTLDRDTIFMSGAWDGGGPAWQLPDLPWPAQGEVPFAPQPYSKGVPAGIPNGQGEPCGPAEWWEGIPIPNPPGLPRNEAGFATCCGVDLDSCAGGGITGGSAASSLARANSARGGALAGCGRLPIVYVSAAAGGAKAGCATLPVVYASTASGGARGGGAVSVHTSFTSVDRSAGGCVAGSTALTGRAWLDVASGGGEAGNSATDSFTPGTPSLALGNDGNNTASSATSITVNWGIPTTSGSTLVFAIYRDGGQIVTSGLASWTALYTNLRGIGPVPLLDFYIYPNAPSMSSVTANMSGSCNICAAMLEVKGAASSSLDNSNDATGTGTSLSVTLPAPTVQASEAVVFALCTNGQFASGFSDSAFLAGPPSGIYQIANLSTLYVLLGASIKSSIGTYGQSASVGAPTPYVAVVASIK